MIDISEKDLLEIIYELTHIKDEEGNDVPNFCFASDASVDLDAKDEEIAVIAAKNGYKVFKVFPGETMLGGLVIVAEGATMEPIETMYKEFYGEVPEITEMQVNDEDELVEVKEEKIEEAHDLGPKYSPEAIRTRNIVRQIVRDNIKDGYVHAPDEYVDFVEDCKEYKIEATKELFDFYQECLIPLAQGYELKDESLKEDLEFSDDEETLSIDELKFGNISEFENKYKQKARELGAEIEFNTKVGPKRLDSLWYGGEDIATIKYNGYTIIIYGDGSQNWITLEADSEPIDFEDFDENGIYNDETFPDCYDYSVSGIEFGIQKEGRENDDANSYSDLEFETMWDLESALDIEWYINEAIPEYEAWLHNITESHSKKHPKDKHFSDPNAKAMWGRTRHRVELPKKGKGSFKRHTKHRVNEKSESKPCMFLYATIKLDSGKIDRSLSSKLGTEPFTEDEIKKVIENSEFLAWLRKTGDTPVILKTYQKPGTSWREVKDDEKELNEEKDNILKKLAKKHKKTDKKGAKGWFVTLNAGNVEKNIDHFNHVAGGVTADGGSTITAPAGLGEAIDDTDLEVADKYTWEFFPANKYIAATWDYENSKNRYYTKIPETCIKVTRDEYLNNVLLKRRKNKFVLNGVKKYFEEHPRAKNCVISCTDNETNRFVNAYRVLAEQFDTSKEVIHYVLGEDMKVNEFKLYEKVEKHDTLNPKLWNEDGTLKQEVHDKIMEIVNDFLKGLADDEIKFNLKDVKLVGSNCSYNYNDLSDLDIHLVADTKSLECPDNLYPLLYSAYRSIWNKNHDISFYGIPVELYIETDDTEQMSVEEPGEGIDTAE